MFVFENCWFVSYLAALNANDAFGNDMAWLVKIIHMCADELQSRITLTAFHKA